MQRYALPAKGFRVAYNIVDNQTVHIERCPGPAPTFYCVHNISEGYIAATRNAEGTRTWLEAHKATSPVILED